MLNALSKYVSGYVTKCTSSNQNGGSGLSSAMVELPKKAADINFPSLVPKGEITENDLDNEWVLIAQKRPIPLPEENDQIYLDLNKVISCPPLSSTTATTTKANHQKPTISCSSMNTTPLPCNNMSYTASGPKTDNTTAQPFYLVTGTMHGRDGYDAESQSVLVNRNKLVTIPVKESAVSSNNDHKTTTMSSKDKKTTRHIKVGNKKNAASKLHNYSNLEKQVDDDTDVLDDPIASDFDDGEDSEWDDEYKQQKVSSAATLPSDNDDSDTSSFTADDEFGKKKRLTNNKVNSSTTGVVPAASKMMAKFHDTWDRKRGHGDKAKAFNVAQKQAVRAFNRTILCESAAVTGPMMQSAGGKRGRRRCSDSSSSGCSSNYSTHDCYHGNNQNAKFNKSPVNAKCLKLNHSSKKLTCTTPTYSPTALNQQSAAAGLEPMTLQRPSSTHLFGRRRKERTEDRNPFHGKFFKYELEACKRDTNAINPAFLSIKNKFKHAKATDGGCRFFYAALKRNKTQTATPALVY